MNYNDWQKEFDDRFVVGGSFKVQGNYLEVKDFIKETINALCDELKMEEQPLSKHFKETNHVELTRDKMNSGFNWAVEELNKKLERIRNETN